MSTATADEILRPFPREASAIVPGLLLSVGVHAALLSAPFELTGLLGRAGESLAPAARFEARLARSAPRELATPPSPPVAVAPVVRPPQPRLLSAAPSPVVVAKAPVVPEAVPVPEPLAAAVQAPPSLPAPVATTSAEANTPAPSGQPVARPAIEPARFDADYLHNPHPIYPRLARTRGQEGEVLLEVAVSADGRALDTQVVGSSGHALLDSAARRTVAGWRFIPARQGTQAVASTVRVPISFRVVDAG